VVYGFAFGSRPVQPTVLPKAVAALDAGDVARLKEARRKVNAGNMLQAILNSVAVLLALAPFVG
jgi:hypothetical protein